MLRIGEIIENYLSPAEHESPVVHVARTCILRGTLRQMSEFHESCLVPRYVPTIVVILDAWEF